jgi:TonB family protein
MYFDFEDNRPDTPRIVQPISRREVVLLTINLHALVVIAMLLGPKIPWVREVIERQQQQQQELLKAELERQQRERERARFVFVQPRVDMTAPKPPPQAELSDLDRQARTVERAPSPTNPLPFSRGNSPERIEAAPRAAPSPPTPATEPTNGTEEASKSAPLPESLIAPERAETSKQADARGPAVGVIADAIKNLRRYAEKENFGNLRGGENQNVSESIQFDTKGVEFGPWLARFVAQVRSNWIIPQAAMSMRGHVVIMFIVHKDGRITDVTIAQPSSVNAFTLASRNAILMSNPTIPLPPEYPDDKMPIKVTFYYNE